MWLADVTPFSLPSTLLLWLDWWTKELKTHPYIVRFYIESLQTMIIGNTRHTGRHKCTCTVQILVQTKWIYSVLVFVTTRLLIQRTQIIWWSNIALDLQLDFIKCTTKPGSSHMHTTCATWNLLWFSPSTWLNAFVLGSCDYEYCTCSINEVWSGSASADHKLKAVWREG